MHFEVFFILSDSIYYVQIIVILISNVCLLYSVETYVHREKTLEKRCILNEQKT